MKKYILMSIISIVLIVTLGVGIKNTKSDFKNHEETFNNERSKCVELNETYNDNFSKSYCDEFLKEEKFTDNIGSYYDLYEGNVDSLENFGGFSSATTSIIKYILFILIGLDSVWFVNDYLKGKKITKKNNDEFRKKAIGVSLIAAIPFSVYSILKVLSPFVVVKDSLLIGKGEIKTTLCYLLAGILISVITSLIGLVLSKRNYNTIKNLMGIIILLVLVELSIFAATELINSVFVVYYEGLETFWYETACTLQVLLLVLTIIVGLILYKFMPGVKESK